MSTELGRMRDGSIYLTRFYGGEKRGASLQITVADGDDYKFVSLSKLQVEWLQKKLKTWLKGVENIEGENTRLVEKIRALLQGA